MRITTTTARILAALLAEPDTDRYGLEIMKATGLASGSLYPVLHRLQAAGWVSAHWEEIDPSQAQRPARRFYRLTPRRCCVERLGAVMPVGRLLRHG